MLLLLLLAGGAGLLYLWKRIEALELRVSLLENQPSAALAETVPFEAETPSMRASLPQAISRPREEIGEPEADPEPEILPHWPSQEAAEPISSSRLWLPAVRFDFEEIFGRLLPIWAGGVALAVAGFFLVRFSIEAGLLTPGVRVGLGFAFGAALLASAEAAFRFESRISDVRVRQALAGAGLATLYASFYLAGAHYGLVGSTLSFLGLAGVTAAAIGLSFRFGLPSAVLGLVGGFAAPTLAGGEDANLPLLALYLSMMTGGLMVAGERQGRSWLGLAALVGGLGWGGLLLLSDIAGSTDTLALGGYILVVGAALPWLLNRRKPGQLGRLIAPALATLQMAALVDQGEYGLLAWFLYVSLAAALGFFAWTEPRLRLASLLASLIALWMLAFWPDPAAPLFAGVAAALTVVFGFMPLARAWKQRADRTDFAQLCAFPLGLLAISYWHFGDLAKEVEPSLALVALGLALIPAAAAWRSWTSAAERLPDEALAALASAAALFFAAGLLATPAWSAPLVGAAIAVAVAGLAFGRTDRVLDLAWVAAGVTLIALVVTPDFSGETLHLAGPGEESALWRSVLRWLAAAAPFFLIAAIAPKAGARYAAEGFAAALGYGLAAQVLPWHWLPAASALAGVGVALRLPTRVVAAATLVAISLLWAIEPVQAWIAAGTAAIAGVPMLLPRLPALGTVLTQVLPALLGAASVLHLSRSRLPERLGWAWAGVGALAVVVLHVVYKQLFAIASVEGFVALGLAERAVWELALVGLALVLLRTDHRTIAFRPAGWALAGTAAAHFGWFTLLLHNPFWAPQAVGPWAGFNLLLPAYLAGVGALVILRPWLAARRPLGGIAVDAAIMVLITVYAMSALRQAFAGSLLQAIPVGETEHLLRSLLGIVLALTFLAWGTWQGARSWRVGSLALMLLAVLKVFLLDAASLEGLARIGSFMALGFSLIGIGWFYSKQLAGPRTDDAAST